MEEVRHSHPIESGERTRLACQNRRPADFLGGELPAGTVGRTRGTRVLPTQSTYCFTAFHERALSDPETASSGLDIPRFHHYGRSHGERQFPITWIVPFARRSPSCRIMNLGFIGSLKINL